MTIIFLFERFSIYSSIYLKKAYSKCCLRLNYQIERKWELASGRPEEPLYCPLDPIFAKNYGIIVCNLFKLIEMLIWILDTQGMYHIPHFDPEIIFLLP